MDLYGIKKKKIYLERGAPHFGRGAPHSGRDLGREVMLADARLPKAILLVALHR
jgi:hypothetical protein